MKPADTRREIPDPGCAGLYLIVQPSGKKSFAVRYRSAGHDVRHVGSHIRIDGGKFLPVDLLEILMPGK